MTVLNEIAQNKCAPNKEMICKSSLQVLRTSIEPSFFITT